MRSFVGWALLLFFVVPAVGQGTPPMDPSQLVQSEAENGAKGQGSPPAAAPSSFQQMSAMIKKQVDKAVEGKPYPSLNQWHPLTTKEKLQIFLKRTYSPRTFEATGVDAINDTIRNNNPQYEQRFLGLGEHYGVDLGTSETEVFFEQFLVPSILKQDPRYFRNPTLPFTQRAIYALSRVFITRADSGHETFNASRIIGGAASQSLADLYVPGQPQGMHPIVDRVSFDLARDAVFNLVHEFWPDLRRKFLHR
jgi:hypothetical protein